MCCRRAQISHVRALRPQVKNNYYKIRKSFFYSSVYSQGCLLSSPQGDTSAFCHEEDQQAESDPEEPDPAGICREGHPHLRREPIRRLYVLLL